MAKEPTATDEFKYQSLFYTTMTSKDPDEVHQSFEAMREMEAFLFKPKQIEALKAKVIVTLQKARDLENERYNYEEVKKERNK